VPASPRQTIRTRYPRGSTDLIRHWNVFIETSKTAENARRPFYVVTGCAGFIGSRVAEMLLARGDRVLGIDALIQDLYPNEPKELRIAQLKTHSQFELQLVDLRSAPVVDLIAGATAVLHFAAMAGLTKSWSESALYESHNVEATNRLLEAMAQSPGSRIIHASTSSVYGAQAIGDETLPLNPVSPYGVTKLAAEESVRAFSQDRGVRATILRFFSVYGPHQRPDMAYSKLCQSLLTGTKMIINGDGLQRRSNTHVDDAARAVLAAVDSKCEGETFNISGSESISLLEAIDVLANTLGVIPVLRHGPAARGDQLETRGNSAKALKILGWSPQIDLHQGLKMQAETAQAVWLHNSSQETASS
jgi:UDP-glucuronate 4-epimerase